MVFPTLVFQRRRDNGHEFSVQLMVDHVRNVVEQRLQDLYWRRCPVVGRRVGAVAHVTHDLTVSWSSDQCPQLPQRKQPFDGPTGGLGKRLKHGRIVGALGVAAFACVAYGQGNGWEKGAYFFTPCKGGGLLKRSGRLKFIDELLECRQDLSS